MNANICDRCDERIAEGYGLELQRLDTRALDLRDEPGPWHFCTRACLASWAAETSQIHDPI